MALITGNKCIAMTWKNEDPPSFSMWFKEVASYNVTPEMAENLTWMLWQKQARQTAYLFLCCLLENYFLNSRSTFDF